MSAIISVNYYKGVMQKIHKTIKERSFEQIMWFGECHMLPLIYDYLAADGYFITVVLDNDLQKKGRTVKRNWCMPFRYGYIDIEKERVDKLIAGTIFPDLKIDLPDHIYNYTGAVDKVLFFMSSYRSGEMKEQLLSMGADVEKMIELPVEADLWNGACNRLHSMTPDKKRMSSEEHKAVLLSLLKHSKSIVMRRG